MPSDRGGLRQNLRDLDRRLVPAAAFALERALAAVGARVQLSGDARRIAGALAAVVLIGLAGLILVGH